MEKLLERIEQIIEGQLAAFENEPIKTSIKFLIYYYIAKFIYKEIKKW